jgi:hypothetical protein
MIENVKSTAQKKRFHSTYRQGSELEDAFDQIVAAPADRRVHRVNVGSRAEHKSILSVLFVILHSEEAQ